MDDKIDELKSLTEKLDAESPLRRQLEEALAEELKRKAEAAAAEEQEKEADGEEAADDASEEDDRGEKGGILGDLEGKLEKLANNDEFITAAAGFVLGAAAVGLGALAASVLRK